MEAVGTLGCAVKSSMGVLRPTCPGRGSVGQWTVCQQSGPRPAGVALRSVFWGPKQAELRQQCSVPAYGSNVYSRKWRSVGTRAGAGDESPGRSDGAQALASKQAQLMEQNKKLLQMQKELLEQIEERKKLHAALMESVSAPSSAPQSPPGASAGRAPAPTSPAVPPPVPRPPVPTPPPARSPPSESSPSTRPSTAGWPPVRARAPPPSSPAAPASLSAPQKGPPAPSPGPIPSSAEPSRPLFSAAVRPKPAPPRPLPAKPPLSPAPAAPKEAAASGKLKAEAAPPAAEETPPPLAGPNVMNVVLVASECAPWSKTGGLGDVVGALPKALARRGHRVMVVAPRYSNYEEAWDTTVRKRYNVGGQDIEVGYFHGFLDGVDFVFVDASIYHHVARDIYGGSREEVQRRMILLCKAAIEAPWHVPCGGVTYGDANLVFVANDWHTALLPVYLQAYYRDHGMMEFTRSILVIHNMAHQGRGPLDEFARLGLPDHYMDKFHLYDPMGGDHMNIFMAGLITAHRIVAVSHGYAWECQTPEGGWGLDGVMRDHASKLRGVVNGIDVKEWSPERDAFLKEDGYCHYSVEALEDKALCKAALQRELGLPERPDVPLIGFIGRLDYQKGVDIIGEAMPWMMNQDLQLALLGSGRGDLEDMLRSFEGNHRSKCRSWVGFSVKMAHRITAGADILLMPSRFEPCGLNQLYAMRYGTVPVVHAVGGLRDTVAPFDPFNNTGLGWTFDKAEAGALIHALGNALYTYREYKDSWLGLQRRGMTQDLSWDNAAAQYEEVLVAAKYTW